MTKDEFEAWKKFTETSKHRWTVDKCQWHNHKTMLAYKGGVEKGTYIMVTADGLAEVGYYEGALPTITDAIFETKHSKQLDLKGMDAYTYVCERMGVGFLMDILRVW